MLEEEEEEEEEEENQFFASQQIQLYLGEEHVVIVESQKYCAISKEMVFYLEMYGYFAAIIASHDRKSINLRAQSMLKNHNKSPF
jgi:hypothetical protein